MIDLSLLQDTHRIRKKVQRVGRGVGSGRGKTACRGQKGNGSRSGYKAKHAYEGGQLPLYRRLPIRGFSNVRFQKHVLAISLEQIHMLYVDGEVVNLDTLAQKGISIDRKVRDLKILSNGELTKKVSIEASSISAQAADKLKKAGVPYTLGT